LNGIAAAQPVVFTNGQSSSGQPGKVHNVTRLQQLDQLLQSAENSCAVIFFTSATCPPCKIVYPAYDELAAEAGTRAVLIKVDLNQAYDIGSKYRIRATPTFMTFLKGEKENEWSGANEAQLRGNVGLLLQMATPCHPHTNLRLPSLQRLIKDPVMYRKCPPLEKLAAKVGPVAQDPAFASIFNYIKTRENSGLTEAPLPNLRRFSEKITESFSTLPTEVHFAVIDLARIAAIDSRVSSFLATEADLKTLMTLIPQDKDYAAAPYNFQLVSLQLACNLFGSPIFQDRLASKSQAFPFRAAIENLASSCLLASNSNARSSAAALVFNLATIDHNERMQDRPDKIDMNSIGDVEAALIQAVTSEQESKETLHNLLLALGFLLYGAAQDAPIWDLCSAMDVKSVLKSKSKQKAFAGEPLLKEIGDELLGKGAPA
jgi:thiol-disulfide isomerase/thioredoxin